MILANVMDALASPQDFFEDGVEPLPFWQPALIVTLGGVLGVIQGVLVTRFALSAVEGAGETAAGIVIVISVITGLLVVFVMWLLFAGFIHGMSALLGADRGSFMETLNVTGWGFLPTLISSTLSVYATWSVLQELPPSAATNQNLQAQLQGTTLFQVAAVVGIVMAIWQGIIWAYGAHEVRGLDFRRAAIVAFVPAAVSIGLTVIGLV